MALLPARGRCCFPSTINGYSLHDALVTLTVVGIMASVTTPSLLQLVERQRLASAVNSLITALMTARSESIKRNVRTVLCPSRNGNMCAGNSGALTEWHHGYLLFVDDNANHLRDPEEPLLQAFDKTLPVRIYSSSYRGHVTYQPNGFAAGTNTSFVLCGSKSGALRTILVSNTGRARVDKGPNTCPAVPG
jgi:type IV fimbrial biogenesis protein FimT